MTALVEDPAAAPAAGDSAGTVYSQFAFYRLAPGFRLLPESERRSARAEFLEAAAASRHAAYWYTTIGLKPGSDLALWRTAPSLEDFQEESARLARTRLGADLELVHSLLGMTRPSQYLRRRSGQEQSLHSPVRDRYLVVYPFTKTIEWHLLAEEERARMMGEHIRVGHRFPSVRQSLLYSFGIDDPEFVVAYETDDLPAFQELVMALRATEGRRYTHSDTPIFACVSRTASEALELVA